MKMLIDSELLDEKIPRWPQELDDDIKILVFRELLDCLVPAEKPSKFDMLDEVLKNGVCPDEKVCKECKGTKKDRCGFECWDCSSSKPDTEKENCYNCKDKSEESKCFCWCHEYKEVLKDHGDCYVCGKNESEVQDECTCPCLLCDKGTHCKVNRECTLDMSDRICPKNEEKGTDKVHASLPAELFAMVYNWGKYGVVVDHTCKAYKMTIEELVMGYLERVKVSRKVDPDGQWEVSTGGYNLCADEVNAVIEEIKKEIV